MPRVRNEGATLYYDTEGSGETVAFVGDVGYGAWQWGWQHAAVAGPYRSLVFDPRGCGRSDAPSGPYSIGTLVSDLEAVLSDANARRAHVVGAGLGGLVALSAAHRLSRVRSVALFGTSADGEDFALDAVRADSSDRESLVRSLRAVLSPGFRETHSEVFERILAWRTDEDADAAAWTAQAAAVRDFEAPPLYEVTSPALVVHGMADEIVPAEAGRRLAAELPAGEFLPIEGAGHLAHVEQSRAVNDHLLGFLDDHAGPS